MSRQVYFEYDNREPSTSRKSFPMGRQSKYYRSGSMRRRVGDIHDVDMDDVHNTENKRRYNPYMQKIQNHRKQHKSKGKGRHDNKGSSAEDYISWHKIIIPHGRKAGKDFIYKSFISFGKFAFKPFYFSFNGPAAEFYVNDSNVARQIRELNRRITTPDGFKMGIQSLRCAPPNPQIGQESTLILKNIMSARYNTVNCTLDLSKFHTDENMISSGLYLPLNRPAVLSCVAKIIKDNIPEIQALVLSDNKLYSLEPLGLIVPVCKQLTSVVLLNNKLRSVVELNSLKGLSITDLVIDGNPLCDDFQNKASYIR